MARKIEIARPLFGEEEWLALKEPLDSGWVTQGPKTRAFEAAFARRHGVTRAVAVSSCTTGLHLALLALGIGPGDEVVVPSFTWVATANAVLYCGATPVLADIDPHTFNVDPADVQRRMTPRVKAVIAVHLFGLCADMDALKAALPGDVAIVEDAACAAGAAYKRRFAGGLGEIAVFSFHPRKIISTGEGGMITTNDERLANEAVRLRNHGASIPEEVRHQGPRPYGLPDFAVLGYNYRMTDLQAAIDLVQLGRLDTLVAERKRWAAYYETHLGDLSWLRLPEVTDGHGWQSYVVYVDAKTAPLPRDAILESLHRRGVSARPGTHAIHRLDYHRRHCAVADGDYPAAHDCAAQTMAIPLHNQMSEEDYAYVVDALHHL